MNPLHLVIPFSLLLSAAALAGGGERAYVERITDGDTIKVRLLPSGEKDKIRILGIDCPESHHNAKCRRDGAQGRKTCAQQVPLGKAAGKLAAKLLKRAKVQLECGKKCKTDRYGRLLRYVRMADGRDFGLEMIRSGLCEDFGWKYPHPRGREYSKVQRER
jgi:micrococcal nuclease